MSTQEGQSNPGTSVAIVAIIAIFVLVLGTVMLFAGDDANESPAAADLAAEKKSEPSPESFEFELKSEEGSVSIQSEG